MKRNKRKEKKLLKRQWKAMLPLIEWAAKRGKVISYHRGSLTFLNGNTKVEYLYFDSRKWKLTKQTKITYHKNIKKILKEL